MIINCESKYDLSEFYKSYGVIRCCDISQKMIPHFNVSQLWTVYSDFFDEMVVDAYDVWALRKNNGGAMLMDFLEEIVPLCSQIAMYWVSFDKDKMTCFCDAAEYKEGVKQIILSDYKCMFYCWYRNHMYFP